jgi:hypothetical protein
MAQRYGSICEKKRKRDFIVVRSVVVVLEGRKGVFLVFKRKLWKKSL